MNLDDTNTVSLLTAISANTETIAVIQNDITKLVDTVTKIQHKAELDHDELWGQVSEIHSLLKEINDTNEYYCDRCHDLLVLVAMMVLIAIIVSVVAFSGW